MTALGESLKRFFERGPQRTQRLNEGISEALRYYLGPTGMDKRLALAAEMNPVQDVYQAGADMRDGNYAGAAVNTASALMPTIGAKMAGGGLADDAANVISDTLTNVGTKAQGAADVGQAFVADEFGGVGPSKGIRAYHGSPHDFDRFSMDAIGTGEGAQAYGHGLYFAENEGVARSYRDALQSRAADKSADFGTLNGKAYAELSNDERAALRMVADWGDPQKAADAAVKQDLRGEMLPRASILNKMASGELPYTIKKGSMYEVNINADPDDFLDWDAGFRQLPKKQQKSLEKLINDATPTAKWTKSDDDLLAELGVPDNYADSYDPFASITGAGAYNSLADPARRGKVGIVAEQRAAERAAQELRDAGIPGIKYLDQGSRGAGDGTRNFVVFDENLIEIVRKYGIAGAAALTGMTAAEVEAAIAE